MNKENKYWYMHWGFSFYLLDEKTHDFAATHLIECLTSNASIYYHKPINTDDIDKLEFDTFFLSKTKSTAVVQGIISLNWENLVSWIYTFVKIKK